MFNRFNVELNSINLNKMKVQERRKPQIASLKMGFRRIDEKFEKYEKDFKDKDLWDDFLG